MDLDGREDYVEDRWIRIGMLRDIPVVIVFTERGADCLRLISALKANQNEWKRAGKVLRRSRRAPEPSR